MLMVQHCSQKIVQRQDSLVIHESIVDGHNRTIFASTCKSKKKTPPKAGFLGFSLGVFPCFHSVKKPSSQNYFASEIRLSKSLGISSLTDLLNLHSRSVNSSQGLAPHKQTQAPARQRSNEGRANPSEGSLQSVTKSPRICCISS